MKSEKRIQLNNKQFYRIGKEGMVSVEVILSFTVFIVVVAGIIYFTNIFIVHNKVQFALNSAAHEIAAYTYLYQAFGVRAAEQQASKDLSPSAEKVDNTVSEVANTLNQISKLYNNTNTLASDVQTIELDPEYISQLQGDVQAIKDSGGKVYESGSTSVQMIKDRFNDPNGTIVGIIYMAVDGASFYAKSLGATCAAKAMTGKYLKQGNMSADDFLKSYGVEEGYEGLDFSGSTMFCDAGNDQYRMIDLVVEYDIHLGLLGLILPEPTVHMVQRASVSAWVGDNGTNKYSDYLSKNKNYSK